MGNFSEGFWNLFIIVVTLGGLAFCLWLAMIFSGRLPEGEQAEPVGHVWDEDLREMNNPLPRWWLWMFYLSIIFAVVYLALYPGLGSNSMLLGWTQNRQWEQEMAAADKRYGPLFAKFEQRAIPDLAKDPEAVRVGERLFASYCTQCHGSDARGVRGFPNLTDGDWLWGGTPEQIEQTILQGRQAQMPAWLPMLQQEGVANAVQYVLSLSGRSTDAAAAEQGKALFMTNCVGCHGPEAKGNPMLGAPNLTDDVWLYGGSKRALETTISGGRQGRMPAHENFLGKAKVHLLAGYVYSLSH